MNNKIKLKKFIIFYLLFSIILILLFYLINIYEYKIYNKNYNIKISSIVSLIEEKYPDIDEKDIIELLNNKKNNNDMLDKYSIDVYSEILLKESNKKYILFNILFYSISILLILTYFLIFNNNKDRDIKKITKYIEEINKKNYKLDLDDMSEEELSILKNEIYKTTIMLKESAENSNIEKLELKKSLSDISHQLKTPLTSIKIILDNLIDNPNMDKNTREDFIKDIKREINNINFLVQTILKLSKFDTNTIEFKSENVELKKIINKSIKNISMLSDLKNTKITFDIKDNPIIKCDFIWQVEAISNILKNSIEHSSIVNIILEDNKVYSKVSIIDNGRGIDKSDLPHIFERFYKGKNATYDSIGIGLSLSKSIIEKDNGKIIVESDKNGTEFIIKYFK